MIPHPNSLTWFSGFNNKNKINKKKLAPRYCGQKKTRQCWTDQDKIKSRVYLDKTGINKTKLDHTQQDHARE